jgi:hypothetical protein
VTAREEKRQTVLGRVLCAVGLHAWTPYFDFIPTDEGSSQVYLGYRCERCDKKQVEAKWPPKESRRWFQGRKQS